jgi:hypothetical protein
VGKHEQSSVAGKDVESVDRPLRVIYILAWGRSGSTLLDLSLGAVDGFFSLGEFSAIWEAGWSAHLPCGCGKPIPDCEIWSRVLEKAGGPSIDPRWMADARLRFSRERDMLGLLRMSRNRSRMSSDLRRYVDTMRRVYFATADLTGSEVLVDSSKVPSDAAMLMLMDGIEPYFLHLVRDPRATAHSWGKTRTQPTEHGELPMPRLGPAYSSMRWLARNIEAELLSRIAGPSKSLRIRFEDFVSHPHDTLKAAVSLASDVSDLPLEGRDLVLPSQAHTVSGHPDRFHSLRIPIRQGEEWRGKLNSWERAQVTPITLPLSLRYRYFLRS